MRCIAAAALVFSVVSAAYGQNTAGGVKREFEAASIRADAGGNGFHFAPEASTGGPGTSDPGMFRCSRCSLASLISRAFELQTYQFPGRLSLGEQTFEVTAKIPPGASGEDFQAMLQDLLQDRFGLAFHFAEKKVRGYRLVVGKNGSKLQESGSAPSSAVSDDGHGHGAWGGHKGLSFFGGSARYRNDHLSAAEVARVLADQLAAPVSDETGLTGKYDVSLAWTGNNSHSGSHGPGGWNDGGHSDHGGGAAPAGSVAGELSGPSLFDAVQTQLGLRLVPAEQTATRVFLIDHSQPLPTEN